MTSMFTSKDKIVLFALLPAAIAAGIFLLWPEFRRAGEISDEIDVVAADIARTEKTFDRMESLAAEKMRVAKQIGPYWQLTDLARDSDQVLSLLLRSAEQSRFPIRLIRPGRLYASQAGFGAREVQVSSVCSHDVLASWIKALVQLPLIFQIRELKIEGLAGPKRQLDVEMTLDICVRPAHGMVLEPRPDRDRAGKQTR